MVPAKGAKDEQTKMRGAKTRETLAASGKLTLCEERCTMKTAATTHTQDKPDFFVGQFVTVIKGGGRAKTYEFVGVITEMYPRFAIVQMPGGYRETFYYEEMQTKNVKPF